MTHQQLQPEALQKLRDQVSGSVTAPGDPGYDEARAVWNGMVDRRPAAVVRAAHVDDVAPTIGFAREQGMDLAIRGGGHNVAGNGSVDGGIVLDLGDLNRVTVDPSALSLPSPSVPTRTGHGFTQARSSTGRTAGGRRGRRLSSGPEICQIK